MSSSSVLRVELCQTPAPDAFGKHNVLSFHGELAMLHVALQVDPLRSIQQAARRIAGLGITSVQLQGDWNITGLQCGSFDSQWAFAQGFASAKRLNGVGFCGAAQSALVCLAKHTEWLKTQVNATPQELSPIALAERSLGYLQGLSAGAISYELIQGDALAKAGYVGVYEVGRGSTRDPVLLSLDYNPSGNPHEPTHVVLVGKGITFDSGGYSIKETTSMLGMKCDMGGAALVTSALGYAIELGLKSRVRLILCCAENLISGHAYKLGDVLRYRNGVSVEIVNTDAEGRLVLADGLIDAQAFNPSLIIDAATLTGAAITALGTDYNAVFTTRQSLAKWYLDLGVTQSEAHWQLPLAPFHRSKCPSAYADTANSRAVKGGGPGGASNAAGFLSRFVSDTQDWLHLDLAAAFADSDGGLFAAGATGLGLRTLSQALLAKP